MKKPIVLTVIDGLGLRKENQGNAFNQANTPVIDNLLATYPNSVLGAAGEAVGLPKGQIGNSEVGHLNIGAGEIVYTGISIIQKTIDDGEYFKNKAFLKAIECAKENKSTIHLMGLLSPGGVHSHEKHLFLLLDLLHKSDIKDVTVHAFTDGRDVAPRSVKSSLDKLMPILKKYNYKLGSIGGRLYGMDRDTNFDKTEIAFEALKGNAKKTFTDVYKFIDDQYNIENHNDEFIDVAINSDKEVKFLKDKDVAIFFNFRPDRARQLSHLLVGSKIYDYKPKNPVSSIHLVTMMKYEGINKADVAFPSWKVKNTIGSVAAANNLKQLRLAETQKYAHVTFFMDGGIELTYPNEEKIMIPSIKVDNYAEAPHMSAEGITDKLIEKMSEFDIVIMNYANPDMVGHTGNLKAAIEAVSFLDKQMGRVKEAIEKIGGTWFITSDHGNAEITNDKYGNPETKHTTDDVFFITTDKSIKLKDGVLANVTPTILDYMGLDKPESMTHDSLIVKK